MSLTACKVSVVVWIGGYLVCFFNLTLISVQCIFVCFCMGGWESLELDFTFVTDSSFSTKKHIHYKTQIYSKF